jgi:de-etiolated-1
VRSLGRFCCNEEQELFTSTTSTNTNRPHRERTINSLKHRILVYLFREAKAKCDAGDWAALRKFYQNFDLYLSLRMWKFQLLDENHLLIKYGSKDLVKLRVHEEIGHASFYVIYNIWQKNVLAVYSNASEELLYLFENFSDLFRNAKLSLPSQWTCSPSNNYYANYLHQRFKVLMTLAQGEWTSEATKVIIAQLPIPAQMCTSSSYLDMSLFRYDDEFVSVLERPKKASEFAIRFFDRDSDRYLFRIFAVPPGIPGLERRFVSFCFHPHQPFAFSIQRVHSDYVVNVHLCSPRTV